MSVSVSTAAVSIIIMTASAVRDALLSLPDAERGFVTTDPSSSDFRVISIERKASGKMEIKYSDIPEP